MTSHLCSTIIKLFIIIGLLLNLLACANMSPRAEDAGGASAMEGGADVAEEIVMTDDEASEANAEVAERSSAADTSPAEPNEAPSDGPRSVPLTVNRLIIKNAELNILVEDTDVTLNRTLGIITEYGGYIVNNRTWFQGEFKYATLTIGVPVDNFEPMLRRLKDLAVLVHNETASGQDVTDQFVDLESRLRNLEATEARVRSFLEKAETVEESLTISNQLRQIEAEIEQIKGRMNYLKDRASYSTITLGIAPQLPTPTPTPTFTPTPTPTPTPTATPWSPSQTFNAATEVTATTARTLFQITVEFLIWFLIVMLPFSLPLILVLCLVWWFRKRG